MTDRNKFEQMLEALINEETEKAKEIFHDIVVEKSRDIYESLLEDDFAPQEEPTTEMFGSDEEGDESEEEPADDEAGDMDMDMGDEEAADGEEMDDSEQTDRILDLEDALEELKAEFEQLMAGDDMGGDDMDMDMGGDASDDMMGDVGMDGMDKPMDEFAFEEEEENEDESQLNEYVTQVGGKQYNQFGKMGDNGVNTKSIVAGKNDMGGTTANIAKSFSTEKGGTQGGLANPSTKEENFGNVNVPGGNAGKTAFKKKEPGHGAEKKGSGDTAPDKKSLIGSRK
jgi:hypothetical protein